MRGTATFLQPEDNDGRSMLLLERGIKLDIEVMRGVTRSIDLKWVGLDGVAVDLTGYTARLTIRTNGRESVLAITETFAEGESGIYLNYDDGSGAEPGAIFVVLEAPDTVDFPVVDMAYTLDVTDSGKPTPVAYGSVFVLDNQNEEEYTAP